MGKLNIAMLCHYVDKFLHRIVIVIVMGRVMVVKVIMVLRRLSIA